MTYTQPLLTILLAIAAFALVFRNQRRRMLAGAAALGLFVLSWPPAAWLLSRPLEARYPIRPFSASPGLQAIVVFAEDIEPAHFERPYPLASSNTYERCLYAAWIYRQYGPVPVLLSGGPADAGSLPHSRVMRDIVLRNGVAENMVWTEEQSGSTRENSLYSAGILKQRGVSRVALVVDATSMPRAAACLRKLGIEVIPAPSSFYQLDLLLEKLLPSWKAIRQNEETLHESAGLLWYRLHGWV